VLRYARQAATNGRAIAPGGGNIVGRSYFSNVGTSVLLLPEQNDMVYNQARSLKTFWTKAGLLKLPDPMSWQDMST